MPYMVGWCSKNSYTVYYKYINDSVGCIKGNKTSIMEFGSSYVFAQKDSKQEFEYVPETRFNHVVTGFSSTATANYRDDGEVCD